LLWDRRGTSYPPAARGDPLDRAVHRRLFPIARFASMIPADALHFSQLHARVDSKLCADAAT